MRPAPDRLPSPASPRAFDSAAALVFRYVTGLSRLCDPRDLRRRWVADLTELSAAFVRSPLFLSLIRLQGDALRRAAGAVLPPSNQ